MNIQIYDEDLFDLAFFEQYCSCYCKVIKKAVPSPVTGEGVVGSFPCAASYPMLHC